ncbi:MAG: acetyl-CoA carboxylase biotin carboxyl carrier protein subunit [Porphyromonadaceae bacterium]|nr:MAG: acetyl-CoA carboxylase biotin carboxyl carrier protein subunit [Porphyromonadaceae bacterium]
MKIDEKDMEIFSYEGTDYKTMLTDKFRKHKPYELEDLTKITAQIPGTMLKILVREGQQINPSKCLFILEAMKMKNKVYASVSGRIKKIHISEGQIVTKNQLLLELGEPESIFKKLLEKSPPKEPKAPKEPKQPKKRKKSKRFEKKREAKV